MDAVKKALQSISQQLLDHPPRDDDSFSVNPSVPSHSFGNSLSRPNAYPAFPHGRPLVAPPANGVGVAFGRMGLSQEMLTFFLICPDEKVGGWPSGVWLQINGNSDVVHEALLQITMSSMAKSLHMVGFIHMMITLHLCMISIDQAFPAICLKDYQLSHHRVLSGNHHQAIITSTTVEVIVLRSVVSAIYGEDGGCLKQIREISDAKITITETKGGGKETLIIISGTPEQTHVAQSLIQTFVISETETC
ncbi:hypothetical protein L6452_35095 [Arctium lappa]|uniref:Uncharacterized protein n=1 Tax=Arctium lappa TaxID=4217 RepID=A0ACB8YK31_ARCLA|nr:hypothetical protein L6452_35095 [Arctium lappa]